MITDLFHRKSEFADYRDYRFWPSIKSTPPDGMGVRYYSPSSLHRQQLKNVRIVGQFDADGLLQEYPIALS